MIVGISVHGRGYRPRPIEYLAEVLHEMAAVARDRDCGDLPPVSDERGRGSEHALRFACNSDGTAAVYTGFWENRVAVWDPVNLRWNRTEADAG